jgi:hypothetical protein
MALTVQSLRIDQGTINAYERLAKKLRLPLTQVMRDALFLALLHIDPKQSGRVRFTGGQ